MVEKPDDGPAEVKRQRMDILLEKDENERIRKEKILEQFREEFKDEFFLIKKKEEEPPVEKPKKSKEGSEGGEDIEGEEEEEEEQEDPLESFEKFIEALGSWKKPLWDDISGPGF